MPATAPPSLGLLALEPLRGLYELGMGVLLQRPLTHFCEKGDGHPVLVLPGLGATDFHTTPLRQFLARLGYDALPWNQGLNVGLRDGVDTLLGALEQEVAQALRNGHKQVSLVGWSLGGVFARELAKRLPASIRQVITLGSPVTAQPQSTHASWLYAWLSGQSPDVHPELLAQLREQPSVPVTSIFSKTDGVVAWRGSLQDDSSLSENIEVFGASHFGMPANPLVLYVVANRLAQPQGKWAPFRVD